MQIKQINLDDDGQPETVVLRMTRQEAAYLALLTGKQNGTRSEEIMDGGAACNDEIYSALTGELFNRYYEDGVSSAAAGESPS